MSPLTNAEIYDKIHTTTQQVMRLRNDNRPMVLSSTDENSFDLEGVGKVPHLRDKLAEKTHRLCNQVEHNIK
jgi:hypothetical protein